MSIIFALLSLCTVNWVTHNYDISAVLTQLLFVEVRCLDLVLNFVLFFFACSFAKFHVQAFGWMKRFKKMHRHYLISD